MTEPRTYHVIVVKRDGVRIEGTMRDDGLQSLYAVHTADGATHFVTVLDQFEKREEMAS